MNNNGILNEIPTFQDWKHHGAVAHLHTVGPVYDFHSPFYMESDRNVQGPLLWSEGILLPFLPEQQSQVAAVDLHDGEFEKCRRKARPA